MARCAGIKRDGNRCEVVVNTSQTYCYQHDPANTQKRKRAASKGGKAKPNREIKDLKDQLATLAEDVLSGGVYRSDAAVVNQIINTRARLVEIERKLREADELEERLSELEDLFEQQKGDRRYGA